MICPNKVCKKEIPSDSVYCDQCGVLLRQCTACGTITLAKFCTECGGVVKNREIIEPQSSTKEQQSMSEEVKKREVPSVEPTVNSGTKIIQSTSELNIIHPNFTLKINDADILGRTVGSHSSFLGKFPVISSRHAKVDLLGNEWYITDLNSSNKTYLNGCVLTPNVPAKLTDKDSLVLANISFTVSIK